LSLPAGTIVGKTTNLGAAALAVVLREVAQGNNDALKGLSHPVVKAWLAATAHFADNMAIEVLLGLSALVGVRN
jgi:hypothetical protein